MQIRKEKKLSQEQLALSANITRHYMSTIENGRTNITITYLEKIAQVLGVKCSELIRNAEELM